MYQLPKRNRINCMRLGIDNAFEKGARDSAGVFDPIRFIEHHLYSRGYEYLFDEEDEVFTKAPSTLAYVNLKDPKNPLLVARESVVERARDGNPHYRFVLAHECGHALAHRRSGKVLAEHELGTVERNRTNQKLEAEANLIAGTLLAPPSLIQNADPEFVAKLLGLTNTAARIAVNDARFWNSVMGHMSDDGYSS